MKLNILNILEEGLHLEAKVSADRWFAILIQEAFEQDYQKGHKAILEVDLQKTCDNISISGTIEVDLNPTCDRCLEVFEKKLLLPLHINLSPYKDVGYANGDEAAVDQDDVNFSFYKGEEIDLGSLLREMLLLEVPIQDLCSESCKGLCPKCGTNLNLRSCACSKTQGDPRFAVLGKLLKN